jgi:hypothetical protein
MKMERLPYEEIDQEKKQMLFSDAVHGEFLEMKRRFEKNLTKTRGKEFLIEEELKTYRDIFNDISEVKFTPRGDLWRILRSKPEYSGEKKFLTIKLIYYLMIIRGRDYDLNQIDNSNLKELREELKRGNDYFLENQIDTEASYMYYQYLEREFGNEVFSSKKLEPKISLNIAEKLVLLRCLNEVGLFPKRSSSETNKAWLEFVGILIGESYQNLTKQDALATKIIRDKQVTFDEASGRLPRLEKINEVLTLSSLRPAKQVISERIEYLLKVKNDLG